MAAIRSRLAKDGFAVANGTLKDVEFAIRFENVLKPAATTRSGPSRPLRPHTVQDAPPRSLSAVYGLGAQPLHTDGAHLLDPPAIIVLHSEHPTETGTAIRQPGYNAPIREVPESVREGIFTVRGNGISFLAGAFENPYRFRFDPVVMSPADGMARAAIDWFFAEREKALIHSWDQDDQLLFIDNRRVLHAREAITDDADTRVLGRLALSYIEES